MSKIMKIFVFALIAVAVATMVIIMFFKFNSRHIADGPGMINTREGEIVAVSYCYSETDTDKVVYTVSEQNDHSVLFEYKICSGDTETVTGSKVLPEGSLDSFRSICRSTGCLINAEYGNPPENETSDSAVTAVGFTLNDSVVYLYSNYQYLSDYSSLFADVCSQFELFIEQ